MRIYFITMLLIAGIYSTQCSADASFHLVYRSAKTDTVKMSFPNDSSYSYVLPAAFIPSNEILDATVVKQGQEYLIKMTLSDAATAKLNALAEANAKALDNHQEITALGFVIDGKPNQVIQGVIHPLSANVLYWRIYPSLTELEAQSIVTAIKVKN